MIAAAALVLLAAALRYRRFQVLATVAGGFAAAAALMAGITYLTGPGGPAPAGLREGSWLAGAGFPDQSLVEHWNGTAWSVVASPADALATALPLGGTATDSSLTIVGQRETDKSPGSWRAQFR